MQHLICLIANQNTFPAGATAPTHAGEVLKCIKFPWCLSGLDKLVVFAATYSNNKKTSISNGGATRTRWVGYNILKDFAVFPSSRRYGLPGNMHSHPIHGRYLRNLPDCRCGRLGPMHMHWRNILLKLLFYIRRHRRNVSACRDWLTSITGVIAAKLGVAMQGDV